MGDGWMSEGALQPFTGDALFGGVGSFVIFVPQIFVLTFLISLLEDSGYMARMAVICHRPLQWFGLSGKSVVPLLSGHACAIPAIYAARTIESPKKSLLTMMVVPLTSCSARRRCMHSLVAVAIPDNVLFGGLLGMQGLAFFILYFMGIAGSLIVSSVISSFSLKDKDDTPLCLNCLHTVYHKSRFWLNVHGIPPFVSSKAGPMILPSTQSFGYWDTFSKWWYVIGEVLFGYDWSNNRTNVCSPWSRLKFTVAILMSFLAREVFVGALGTMMGLEDDGTMEDGLIERLQSADMPLGTSIGLLVFYVFAMQCVSTLAVLRQEIGNLKTPVFIFMGYNLLAYVLAWCACGRSDRAQPEHLDPEDDPFRRRLLLCSVY